MCGPEHVQMEALAAGINVARCSLGVQRAEYKTLSGKGVIRSKVSKLGKETQSR